MVVVVLEHVRCEDWVSGKLFGHVESKVAMFIIFRDLV